MVLMKKLKMKLKWWKELKMDKVMVVILVGKMNEVKEKCGIYFILIYLVKGFSKRLWLNIFMSEEICVLWVCFMCILLYCCFGLVVCVFVIED